ncbi:predicted protein [Naegleria gruberi]|uniref:Predicted protein n=1 Tax=Naegleria gruberi TaxID=5762 RepID=D2W4K5_NAEGR|nr:uncharacterized protein NAEGRDRAFT_76339 [Naegleria gruberi]EFC35995.1 predicted protein [Naegleria gruberi]|eukprot:XP_002668739.1 predicted protein [Naegleria gruberi strain NEG-M]
MIKGLSSYLDDGNIVHLLCETPNAESKILKSLIESLQKLETLKSEEMPSVKDLVKKSLFGTNSRGLQPIHTACFFNESEELFRELVRLQDEYETQYESSVISLQHENLDPRCKKNMYLLMFKLIITSTPHNSLSSKSFETVQKEQELNDKCMDFIFDKMGLTGDQLARITHQGVSLINYACKYNRLHLVKKMLEKSNIDVNLHVDNYYHNPLTSAVLGGAFNVVKYLIDEVKVDVEARESETQSRRDFPSALHLAILRGHFEIAHFLISRGANMNATCKMSSSNGSSIEASDPMVNKALFGNRHGLDSSFGVSSPSTSCAAKEDREEVHNLLTLCMLLCTDKQETSRKTLDFLGSLISNYDFKPTFPSTNTTITMNEPIWFAIRTIGNKQGCDQIFEWILNHFYSDRQKLANLRDKNKNNMLHWISGYGRVEMLEIAISYMSEDSSMDVHVMMNQKNLSGDTPLHVASQLGRKDICTKLIDLGADIRVRNMKLQDPLSATFVGSANSTLTAQFRIAFLKDLRKAVENRESGKTILNMQAKIRMLERKLSETKLVESPLLGSFKSANVDP